MPYSNKDRQRAYQRDWVRRRRQQQGSTSKRDSVEPVTPVLDEPINASNLNEPCTDSNGKTWTQRKDEIILKACAGPLTKERQVKGFNKR